MPAGPILAREILTTPRRARHYMLRSAIVALFFVLLWTAWQAIIGFQRVERLSDLAYFNEILFPFFAYTQLAFVLFAASLYGAVAISHEKDRRTFILLLVTRLTDQEIVLDKFLCGMLQVGVGLAASLPVFLLAALLGGVSFEQVGAVFAVAVGTAIVAGATGVFIAVWREKTFQSVALAILAAAFALLLIEAVAGVFAGRLFLGEPVGTICDCLSPLRATAAVMEGEFFSSSGSKLVGKEPWVFVAAACLASVVLLFTAVWKLRDWNPRGEPIQQAERFGAHAEEEKSQKPRRIPSRPVWTNPVLWREVRTRAYGTRPIIVKLGFVMIFALLVGGLVAAWPAADDPQLRLILGRTMLPICILSLLLVNAQAVASVTSERDLKSLDLLLATDVTPKEFIFGKLAGIAFNMKEMAAAPVAVLIGCAIAGWIDVQVLVYSAIALLVFFGFSAVLGVHAALRYESSRAALANSLGTMFLLFVGILICLFLILISGQFEAQWGSFVLFIVIGSIALWVSLSANAPSSAVALTAALAPAATFYCLVAVLVGDRTGPFLVVTGVYGFAVASLLVPLVSEFDVATGRTTSGEG